MKKSGFLEGAFIATLAIFITKFLGIIYVIPFYDIVGPQGGALYGYAYNIYNLFLIISSAGIPLAISKLTSEYNTLKKYREKNYMYKSAKKFILIFSIVSFLICYLFAPWLAKIIIGDATGGNTISDIAFVIRSVSFAILVVPLLSISKGYLQGHGFIKPASYSQVIEQIVRVLFIIIGSFTAINLLKLDLKTGVGVAVFGACIGAIIAYIYLGTKLKLIKHQDDENKEELTKSEKKEILQKLVFYAIPFIIISVANSLYNSTDMILINRGLINLGYEMKNVEIISSVFTTWGHKLNSIVTSIATGIAISLIPSISKNNALHDYKKINDKFNKLLQVFFYIALPISIFMSIFAKEIWTIFYGTGNDFGPQIFTFQIIVAAIDALYIMVCNGLQGLNKSKLIYIAVISGLLINLFLDIPLMYLLHYLGIPAYYGAIFATIIGYTISLLIPLVSLKKEFKMDFSITTKKLPKLFGIYLILIFLSLVYRAIINSVYNRFVLIILVGFIGIILLIIYYFLNKKNIEEFMGKSLKDIIRKKRDK